MTQLENIEPAWGYLTTLQEVQGFCHCPKGSKGFMLGLGQSQKVSSDTDNHKSNTNPQGLHKGHQDLTVGINDQTLLASMTT